MKDFTGKTVLITGCNRGIGKSVLEKFASNGANIIACIRNVNAEFTKFIENLSLEHSVEIECFELDLSNEDSIKSVIKTLYSNKKDIDILVNNAGVVSMKLLQMTTMQELKDVFQVNFFSQVLLTQGISKLMMRKRSGIIINLCSVGGLDAFPAYTAYGCSKAAMSYFTKTMAKELASYNIRVNAVAPGLVDTDMQKELSNLANDEVLSRTSIKRPAKPSEVADTILYLASEKSSYINGQIIRIDGGM